MRAVLPTALIALTLQVAPSQALLEPPVTLPPPIMDAATREPLPPPRALEQVLAVEGLSDARPLKAVIEAYQAGRITEGDALAATLAEGPARTLAEWVALREGVAPLFRLERFMAEAPDWPGQAALQRRAEERLLMERTPPARVRAFFETRKPSTTAGRVALAFAMTDRRSAAALARAIWIADPLSEAVEQRLAETFKDDLTVRDHAARAEAMIARKAYPAALRAAAKAGDDYGLLARARIAAARGAGKATRKALDAVPASRRKDPAYFLAQAQVLRHERKHSEAAAILAAITGDVVAAGDAWWTERRYIAREMLDLEKFDLAYRVARAHDAESAANRIEAEFMAGWIALQFLGRPRDAALHFSAAAAIATTPISRARADYWLGRAAEADDRMPDATALYEQAGSRGITYYGQLARGRLGLADHAIQDTPRLNAEDAAAFRNRGAIRALALLEAMDQSDLAVTFYRELAQSLSTDQELGELAAIARQHRDAPALLAIGKIATQRGFRLDSEAFPTFGIPLAAPTSAHVDPAMVYAIARQESAFAVDAQSHAGARGLMQLMPATARETARQIGKPFELDRLTRDAAYNATLGAAHLGELMQAWRGSYILTFASYNAGPGNVKKWITAYGDPRDPAVDAVDWVERIPFSETRNYVQRVMENLKVYRHRITGSTVVLSEAELQAGSRTRYLALPSGPDRTAR